MKLLLIFFRGIGLIGFTTAFLGSLYYWYQVGYPKPVIVDRLPNVIQLVCFLFIWLAFSRSLAIRLVGGWLLLFSFFSTIAHLYADAIGFKMDPPGFENFPTIFVINFIFSFLACAAALIIFSVIQFLRGKRIVPPL